MRDPSHARHAANAGATRIARALLGAALLGAVASSTSSASERTLRFTVIDIAPYGLVGADGAPTGAFSQIGRAIARAANLTLTESVLPLKRAILEVHKGRADCAIFIRSSWSKANFAQIAEVMSAMRLVVVPRARVTISSLDDLRNYTLAIPHGSFDGRRIAEDPAFTRIRTNGYGQSIRLLARGRVDAVAATGLTIAHYVRALEVSPDQLGAEFEFDRLPVWLQCTKDALEPAIAGRLRTAANAIVTDGSADRILDVYR